MYLLFNSLGNKYTKFQIYKASIKYKVLLGYYYNCCFT